MLACCRRACSFLYPCLDGAKQALAKTVIELNEVRRDPEGFQRICLVALSALEGINYYFNKNYLPKLVQVLDVANSFDFYGFLKIPYYLFHAIDSDRIDEFKTLESLEHVLCENWNRGTADSQGVRRDPQVYSFARTCLEALLEQMNENDWAYIDDRTFKAALKQWMIGEVVNAPQYSSQWSSDCINLSSLKIAQKKDSWLETLANINFIVVDIICIPTFLRDWNLMNLQFYANRLGQYRLFAWVPNQSLDTWVRIGLCTGFLLRFLEAWRCLSQSQIGRSTIKRAQWELVVSAAEFVFNSSILYRAPIPVVLFFTFVAKSLGVISIICRPNTHYFEEH